MNWFNKQLKKGTRMKTNHDGTITLNAYDIGHIYVLTMRSEELQADSIHTDEFATIKRHNDTDCTVLQTRMYSL